MDNLGARIQDLVSRLSGREAPGSASTPPPDSAETEAAYRQALKRWSELTAQGPAADQADVARVYQELLRLTDEVGEPAATRLRQQWAKEWHEATGHCPWCGQAGPYHDPALGSGNP